MQSAYKAAVEEWIAAIRNEEALASVNHTVAQVESWENAADKEDEARQKAKAAKKDSRTHYERNSSTSDAAANTPRSLTLGFQTPASLPKKVCVFFSTLHRL